MSGSLSGSLDGSFPPSPKLSWASLLLRLAELKPLNHTLTHLECSEGDTGSVVDADSSVLCYPLEETLAAEVVEIIAQRLKATSDTLGCSRLLVPECLLPSVGQELLHLAASEPCGLRGALVDLCVDRHDSLCKLEQIAVDADVVPTFHVTLVLRAEAGGLWLKVQRLFKGDKKPHTPDTLRLDAGFRAIKQKLYSSGELLVEECCC
ncbi:DNA damage-inducible transcript 4 protein-like [Genypterus blacodes]|uniref:DNA damage-inducible transcript 4 protein-like n=1 Tax=Genypterus blacodes TaxID=154954 RepID=UPI003F76B2ED